MNEFCFVDALICLLTEILISVPCCEPRAVPKKDARGSEVLVLDALRSGIRFQKFVAEAALKVTTLSLHFIYACN